MKSTVSHNTCAAMLWTLSLWRTIAKITPLVACFIAMLAQPFPATVRAQGQQVRDDAYARSRSEHQIIVSGTQVPGLLNQQNPGPYNVLFAKILEDFPGSARIDIRPLLRAQRDFYGEKSDCMFVGTSLETVHEGYGVLPDDLILSNPVATTRIRVYSRPGEETVGSLLPLVDARVAADMSTGSNKNFVTAYLPPTIQLVRTNTLTQAFQLLDLGRVNHVMAFDMDVNILTAKNPKFGTYPYTPDYAVVTHEDVVQCHRNEKTERFIEHVNARIVSLSHTGELQALLDFE